MSIIAWDGKIVAADNQGTNSDMISTCIKLKQLLNKTVIGYVGPTDTGLIMMEWFMSGTNTSYPECQKEEWAQLIIFQKGYFPIVYEQYNIPLPFRAEFGAWGCGRDYAIGAMAAGCNAIQAVDIASRYNIYCGNGYTSFTL